MSKVVLFEPHYDDAVLFACYALLELRPLVVTVFGGGDRNQERYAETSAALASLGLDAHAGHQDWAFPDIVSVDEAAIEETMRKIIAKVEDPAVVWAPLPELGGHAHHNLVGQLANRVFGDEVRYYATYARGHGRTRASVEVEPEPGWAARKYRALSWYTSQIERADTRAWFCADDVLREWVV